MNIRPAQHPAPLSSPGGWQRAVAILLAALFLAPLDLVAALQLPETPSEEPSQAETEPVVDAGIAVPVKDDLELYGDTTVNVVTAADCPYGLDGKRIFNPNPERAVWLSALFPGLGQIYNRRYWKLPIIVGGFMGLGYATSWNNSQYRDYTQGYRDLLDSDPDTKSYMDFFPPNTDESSLDTSWLTQVMKSRKDYYRRNRDLCIICLVGLYLLCMVDAYVDASLAHFDISPDLSMDVQPALFMNQGTSGKPALGLAWAVNF